MRKYVFLALLCIPVTAFAVPSVRTLGNKSTDSGTVTATPAVLSKPMATGTDSSTMRVGTLRSKTASGTVSNSSAGSESRFPVIMPTHAYSSVVTPKTGGTFVTEVNTSEIVDTIIQNIENNYYNKTEVTQIINQALDDPRFDMVQVSRGSPESKWRNHPKYQQRLNEGYVFMWVEE